MAVLPLRYHPDPALRGKARRVREIDGSIHRLVADMMDTLRHHSGAGLAAPQVGVGLRVVVLEPPEQPAQALINPEIVSRRGEREVEEGCLSVPGYRGKIRRAARVTVRGLDLAGQPVRVKGEGLLAQVLEHEIDHLNGILYIDRLEGDNQLYPVEPVPPPPA